MRKFWLIAWWCIIGIFLSAARPIMQGVEFTNVSQFFDFGQQIVFQVTIKSPQPMEEVVLFFQPLGESTQIFQLDPGDQGEIVYKLDATSNPVRAFTRVEYWYRVKTGGQNIDSPHFSFDYSDNRFPWENLKDDQFEVFWYTGDLDFGQSILNTARLALDSAQNIIPANLPKPLKIYVYSDSTDLQDALQLAGQTWVAGHASPDLGVVLLSISVGPDQRIEMERQLPHELTHILQYQLLGDKYNRLPIWLAEGSASIAELYPNPDYQRVIDRSAAEGVLLPMRLLCNSFPQEASGAFLAYAQSTSFSRFFLQSYGTSKLNDLMLKYADGFDCAQGMSAAVGLSLDQVETRWQQEYLGINPTGRIFRNLGPYMAIAAVFLIPLVLFIFRRA